MATREQLLSGYPRPPAQIAGYVEVLGIELTVTFLLKFGGAELSIAEDPKGRSQLEALVGYEKARAMATIKRLAKRVPLAKPWIAGCLHHEGKTVAEIARTLHVSDVTVRGYLHGRQRQGTISGR